MEANSLHLEKTPFQKGTKTILKELPPLKGYQLSLTDYPQDMLWYENNKLYLPNALFT